MLAVCTSANAVKPEKNSPGYLTDGHGACGVLQALLTVVDDFPEAEPYIESTIRWLYDVRIEMKGGYVWRMSTTAPKGHQSYGLRPSVSFQLAVLSLRAHRRKPNELYVKVADGAMDLFFNHVEGYYRKTEFGEGVFFPAYIGGQPLVPATSGKFQGGVLSLAAELYELSDDPRALRLLKGLVNEIAGRAHLEGDRPVWEWWQKSVSKKSWRSGQCYGIAGTIWGLFDAYETIPDHRFPNGSSIRDLANSGLDLLGKQALERENLGGVHWPNISYVVPTENTGWGRGQGGVGASFLRGYQANRDSDPERAKRYLRIAKQTAISIAEQLIDSKWDYRGKSHHVQGGGLEEMNLGWCGGVGGTPRFLFMLANEVNESDPKVAEQCVQASKVVRDWFEKRSIPWSGGGRIWHAREKFGGVKVMNIAMDYGLSGMVRCLHLFATELDDKQSWDLARDATCAMLSLAVKEEEGTKWPLFTRLQVGKLSR